MGIKADIAFRRLKASLHHRKLQVTNLWSEAVSAALTTRIWAGVSHRKLVAEFFAVVASSGKFFSNSFSLSEQSQWTLSRPIADSIMVSDDNVILFPRKGLTNSVSMTDSHTVEHLVADSKLNQGLVGFMLLNA